MNNNELSQYQLINRYKNEVIPILQLSFPMLSKYQIEDAINYSIEKRIKNSDVELDNSYKKKTISLSLLEMTEYILSKEPIMTSSGVLFRKHSEVINPISKLLQGFMDNRNIYKSKMYNYPKGSELYEKYNLFQLLAKIDANALYGSIGNHSCIYYNLYTAESITSQGQLSISTAAMCFESLLANNVKFRNLDEIVTFINNILREKRIFNDNDVLDDNIDLVECFNHIIMTCGNGYIPDEDDLQTVWDIMSRLTQEDINRLFYKNNIFAFMNNKTMVKAITYILQKLEKPYLNPNKPPKEIIVELESLWEIINEYVFYNYAYIDCINRTKFLPRKCTLLIDTDSNLIYLEPWYKFVLEKTYNVPMKIKTEIVDPFTEIQKDEFGDSDPIKVITKIEQRLDYDFYTDEVIEIDRLINPIDILPQDGLRHSIINIMAFILDKVINSAMLRYTKSFNSYNPDKKCMMIMKNEYLFKRLLVTESKKTYASIIELQEGHRVNNALDIKGLGLNKSTLNIKSQEKLQRILAEDILKSEEIDQIKVLKKIILMEKEIYSSLLNGNKEYYKPLAIKSMYSYQDPMRQQGIKASVAWNELRDSHLEAIDLERKNFIDVVKVNINSKTVESIKESNPDIYQRVINLLKNESFSKGITTVAIPHDVDTPKWLLEFIDYKTIINDNITNFKKPLESIGIQIAKNKLNYTNILSL